MCLERSLTTVYYSENTTKNFNKGVFKSVKFLVFLQTIYTPIDRKANCARKQQVTVQDSFIF